MFRLLIATVLLLVMASPARAQGDDTTIYFPVVGMQPDQQHTAPIILPCTEQELADMADESLQVHPPNPDDDSGCMVPTVTFESDMHSMIFDGDPLQGEAAVAGPSMWTWPRKVSLYRLDCGSPCQLSTTWVTGALGIISQQGSYKPGGDSWDNYFVGNWMSIGPSTVTSETCPNGGPTTRPHILIGVGVGRFSSTYTSSVHRVFVENYTQEGCYTTIIAGWSPPSEGVHVELYTNSWTTSPPYYSYWTARYWRSNQWYYIWTNEPYRFVVNSYLMIGGEAGASTLGNITNLSIPLQYIHKIRVKQPTSNNWKSYHETNIGWLGSPLAYKTTKQADSPIVMLDWNTGYNFTSMAWEMNPPSGQ